MCARRRWGQLATRRGSYCYSEFCALTHAAVVHLYLFIFHVRACLIKRMTRRMKMMTTTTTMMVRISFGGSKCGANIIFEFGGLSLFGYSHHIYCRSVCESGQVRGCRTRRSSARPFNAHLSRRLCCAVQACLMLLFELKLPCRVHAMCIICIDRAIGAWC